MMGLFDFFKRKDVPPPEPVAETADKKVASLGKKASDKRAQDYDRDEAIRALIQIGTHEAAIALLKRFSLKVDPSITDQAEKQLAFDGIVSIGRGERGKRVADAGKDPKQISSAPLTQDEVAALRDAVVDGVRDYCDSAENLTWPLNVLRALLDDEAYVAELLALLDEHDTEYTRNVEPKINILVAMESVPSQKIRDAAEEYLQDVNETVRFHAVQTLFAQAEHAGDDAHALGPMVAMLADEESVRIKNKVCEGVMQAGWTIPAALRDAWRDGTRDVYEYRTSADGKVTKS